MTKGSTTTTTTKVSEKVDKRGRPGGKRFERCDKVIHCLKNENKRVDVEDEIEKYTNTVFCSPLSCSLAYLKNAREHPLDSDACVDFNRQSGCPCKKMTSNNGCFCLYGAPGLCCYLNYMKSPKDIHKELLADIDAIFEYQFDRKVIHPNVVARTSAGIANKHINLVRRIKYRYIRRHGLSGEALKIAVNNRVRFIEAHQKKREISIWVQKPGVVEWTTDLQLLTAGLYGSCKCKTAEEEKIRKYLKDLGTVMITEAFGNVPMKKFTKEVLKSVVDENFKVLKNFFRDFLSSLIGRPRYVAVRNPVTDKLEIQKLENPQKYAFDPRFFFKQSAEFPLEHCRGQTFVMLSNGLCVPFVVFYKEYEKNPRLTSATSSWFMIFSNGDEVTSDKE